MQGQLVLDGTSRRATVSTLILVGFQNPGDFNAGILWRDCSLESDSFSFFLLLPCYFQEEISWYCPAFSDDLNARLP